MYSVITSLRAHIGIFSVITVGISRKTNLARADEVGRANSVKILNRKHINPFNMKSRINYDWNISIGEVAAD